MYVCICAAVTEAELRNCIRAGAATVDEVGDACGAGTGCGTCHERIDVFLLAGHAPSELEGLPATA
jgi:bacterioferritin-associated ferredoxin